MENIFRYEDFLQGVSEFLNKVTEGLVVVDTTLPRPHVVYVNNGFIKLTGYSFDDVESKDVFDILCGTLNKSPFEEIYKNLKNYNPFSVPLTFTSKDGKLCDGIFSFTPVIVSKTNKYCFITIQDITATKKHIEQSTALKAIKVTLASINDIIFNYMNYLMLFRELVLELNGTLNNQILKKLLNEYDYEFRKTYEALSKFNDLDTFHTKYLSKDFEILDL